MPACHDDFNYSERIKMRNVYECRTQNKTMIGVFLESFVHRLLPQQYIEAMRLL